MLTVGDVIDAISDFIDLKDTYDASYATTTGGMALSDLDKACENYINNPSPETAQAVKDANKTFLEAVEQFFSAIATPGNGSVVELQFDFVNKINSMTEEAILLEYNERMKKSKEKYKDPTIDTDCKARWDNSQNWQRRSDPLTLDLDGDGLETTGVGIFNPIYFDHDGDGIKNGSGWVKPDDAFLVLDKNGNGTIDNGRELFGDSTIKSNGQKAKDGFDALTDLDSNADGIVNNTDTQFTNLKLWRDLNQDGISQEGELFTLDSQNIVGINIAKTANNQTLTNGNQIADTGSFIKGDGSTGTVGEVTGNLGDINLADDTFHRQFADQLDTTAVASLPDMQGSGAVRDLREAATQSATLQSLLTQYSAATTREAQFALIDQMLDAWADTSGYAETLDARVAAMPDVHVTIGVMEYIVPYYVRYEAFGSLQRVETSPLGSGMTAGGGGGGSTLGITHEGPEYPDVESDWLSPEFKAAIATWDKKIHILEAFNGNYFFGLPGTEQTIGATSGMTIDTASSGSGAASSGGGGVSFITSLPISIGYDQAQLDFLQQSYDALKESVYESLILQTRFKPLLDQINLVIDSTGINLDFSQLQSHFETKISQNAALGMSDLIEFNRASKTMLKDTGWNGWQLLQDKISTLALTPELQTVYAELHVMLNSGETYVTGSSKGDIILSDALTYYVSGGEGNDVIYASATSYQVMGDAGDDILIGQIGNDRLEGGLGNDLLRGDDGDDTLYGDAGDDLIDGGTGNDSLHGGDGADIYKFGIGSGQDTIYNYDSDTGAVSIDQVDMTTLRLTDVQIKRESEDLVISINNSKDQLRIFFYFYQDGTSPYAVDKINFADGVFDLVAIKAQVGMSTAEDDYLTGYEASDTLNSLQGNDTLNGRGGDDVLDSGAGRDSAYGDAGNDTLIGGTGDDYLNGGADHDVLLGGDGNDSLSGDTGNDTLDGGAGNDYLTGGEGADTYKFGIGSGQDTINNYEYDNLGDHADTVLLGIGIGVADVSLTRNGSSLYISINGTNDQLEISSYFLADGTLPYAVENIQFADGTIWDVATVKAKLLISTAGDDAITGYALSNTLVGGNGNDNLEGRAFADTLEGGAGDDYLYSEAGNDNLIGGAGNDILMAGADSDILLGGDGNDTLYGDTGNDILDGGAGNDSLNGGDGADIYKFGIGSGQDTINNYDYDNLGDNADTILLGVGITTAGISVTRSGDSLLININNTNDRLEVANYFYSNGTQSYVVENIQFADGTIWDKVTVKTKVLTGTADNDYMNGFDANDVMNAGDGADTLYGGGGNDTLNGGTGADSLSGDTGNDTLDGGAGNDSLTGGDGADIYKFDLGSGYDTINNYDNDAQGVNIDTLLLGVGLTSANTTFTRNGDILSVSINGTKDQLDISNYFYGNGANSYTVENIQFASGTIWDYATVNSNLWVPAETSGGYIYGTAANEVLTGSSANDYLSGDAGSDVLDGGAGNDSLSGGDGADIYKFGIGSGHDVINNYDADSLGTNADTILLGSGIATTGVRLTRSGDSLYLNINGKNDRLEISNFFYEDATHPYAVENIQFADGTIWNVATVKSKVAVATAGNDSIIGYASNDILSASIGEDSLEGRGGNDTLDGGVGSDTLYGGDGNDILNGGAQDDYLSSDAGNDTLDGGAGNDRLMGGDGADIYKFGIGSGLDVIYNWDSDEVGTNADTVLLGAGITTTGITLTRSSDSLYISINGKNDKLEVSGYFSQDGNATSVVENIQFADGTIWDVDAVKAKVIIATAGDDNLTGYDTNDALTGSVGKDSIAGRAGDDVLDGGEDDDYLAGEEGDDTLKGGIGRDTLYGGTGNDELQGQNGDDYLHGDAGNDTLDGGAGNDRLTGGDGADIYKFGIGSGLDVIYNWDSDEVGTNADTVLLGAGITTTGVTLTRSSDSLYISINGKNDKLEVSGYFSQDGNATSVVENIQFADGTIWNVDAVKAKIIVATEGNDTITGFGSVDTLNGLSGNDYIAGQAGDDIVDGGADEDNLDGGEGNDFIKGGTQNDRLIGGADNDILFGDQGDDYLSNDAGNDLLVGGLGNDSLGNYYGGKALFIGGVGKDTAYVGTDTIIAFNKGDGQDTVNTYGTNNTLSIGGGTSYADLTLSKSGSDLILKTGSVEQIVFANWYSNMNGVINLQVIAEAMADFNLGSSDSLRDNKVESFNFAGLVSQFDAEGATTNWQLTDARLTAHLQAGSDTAAIGGDLAYQYGRNSNLTGMGLANAQSVIASASFGQTAQTLNNPSVWQAEVVKLG